MTVNLCNCNKVLLNHESWAVLTRFHRNPLAVIWIPWKRYLSQIKNLDMKGRANRFLKQDQSIWVRSYESAGKSLVQSRCDFLNVSMYRISRKAIRHGTKDWLCTTGSLLEIKLLDKSCLSMITSPVAHHLASLHIWQSKSVPCAKLQNIWLAEIDVMGERVFMRIEFKMSFSFPLMQCLSPSCLFLLHVYS